MYYDLLNIFKKRQNLKMKLWTIFNHMQSI